MIETMVGLIVIVLFAVVMSVITALVRKSKRDRHITETVHTAESAAKEPNKKGVIEKYCNDKKNDSRRQLANYILIHEEEERRARGQED